MVLWVLSSVEIRNVYMLLGSYGSKQNKYSLAYVVDFKHLAFLTKYEGQARF